MGNWGDSFSLYAAWQELQSEYSVTGSGFQFTANGRNGNRCIEISGFGPDNYIMRSLGSTETDVAMQAAFTEVIGQATNAVCLFELRNASNQSILAIERGVDGLVYVRRGAAFGGTILGVSTGAISSSYRLVEVRAKIHATTGEVDVLLDGVTEISLTSQNTEGASGGADRVKMGGCSTYGVGVYFRMTDLVVRPGATGLIGDVGFKPLSPNGDQETDFTPTGGSTTYTELDERPSDGDTTSADSSTPGNRIRCDLEAHGLSGVNVLGVMARSMVTQTVPGSEQAQVGLYHTASEALSAAKAVPSSNYGLIGNYHADKPGGSGWSLTDIDDLQVVLEHA